MDTIKALPTRSIGATIQPTIQAFLPLLLANSSKILSTARTTHAYGSHPRQTLDVYSAATNPTTSSPILIFLYGGGLVFGDKIIPGIPQGLVYHNLGAFFAARGFTTVVADYRRVNNPETRTGEDAVFPSGGIDLSLVLSYLSGPASPLQPQPESKPRDVFIMGNSAGGIHLSTFLLHAPFLAQRRTLLAGSEGLKLKAAVLLSVPCDFESSSSERAVTNATYWPSSLSESAAGAEGAANSCAEFSPRGLLAKLRGAGGLGDVAVPPVLLAEGELDPEDEILEPMARFEDTWGKTFGAGVGLDKLFMEGQNHISPVWALGCGDEYAEKWGEDVVSWLRSKA